MRRQTVTLGCPDGAAARIDRRRVAAALAAWLASCAVCVRGQGRIYQAGLVESLAHPRGRVTRISNLADRLVPKRIELLKETVPSATRIAIARCSRCKHTSGQSEVDIEAMQRDETAAARSLGVAKALGVAIPQRALLRADVVIE